jgi:Orsellinic acid/F9775 biosynthesis cluster protein D
MDHYIKYDWEFRLVICVSCKTGIPKDSMTRHFRNHHKETWKSHREALIAYTEGMRLVATEDLDHPTAKREAIEGLEIKDGWTCGWHGCVVSGVNKVWMVNHCRQSHGVKAVEGRPWTRSRLQTLLTHPHIKSFPSSISSSSIDTSLSMNSFQPPLDDPVKVKHSTKPSAQPKLAKQSLSRWCINQSVTTNFR